MIHSFTLQVPPRILFGPGRLSDLGEIAPRFGRRPLLVLGGKSFESTDHCRTLLATFRKQGLSPQTVHIRSEPSPELIDGIVADQEGTDRDMVIAIGGGSALDGGKALAAMLVEKGSVTRFLERVGTEQAGGGKLPFIAVPTTSGTGSEATANAVISSVGASGFKRSLRHDRYIPDLALIDPALTLSCPRRLTVACGMDCFTQLVEGYLSTHGSRPTDTLALDGIRAVHRSLETVCRDGGNLAARTDMSYGALLSGIVLANAGLGTVHGFASAIGGFFAVPHGVVCGTLMAATNRSTVKNLRRTGSNPAALDKYAVLGRECSGATARSDSWYQDFFIDELTRLTDDLQIPRLDEAGIERDDIAKIIDMTGNKYNPARLSPEELTEILLARMNP
jgi:alcohol dehydrogenase class IV